MWSAGVILYILVSGAPPFFDDDLDKVYEKILVEKAEFNGKFHVLLLDPIWSQISDEAKHLISNLLCS